MNRVTVFERDDATSIFLEWWDDLGRHKQSFATLLGHPVTDRDTAKELARRASIAQEQKRNQQAREIVGLPVKRTLPGLLHALHMARASEWSDGYRQSQERQRRFWESKLGHIELDKVSPALVERIASEEAKRRKWTPRTRGAALRYIVDAFRFAQRKLKWITERENLSAVDVPGSKAKVAAYTLVEARKLLPALEAVDPRAGWIGHVAFQTGRRLRAIRTLGKSAVTLHDGYAVLAFPAETDKARQEGRAVVVGRAYELTRTFMTSPGKYVVGKKPPANSVCNVWIRSAEEAAGVEHRERRGWHGLKRLFATLGQGMVGREKQSGTTGTTLDRIYVQDDMPPKVRLAESLAERLAGR